MLRYVLRYKKYIALNCISVFGFVLIELGIPTLLAKVIDVGFATGDYTYVLKMAGWMTAIALVGLVGLISMNYCVTRITNGVILDIRNDIFGHIQGFSHQEYETFGVSALITSTTNDPYQVMLFLQMILRTGLVAPMMFISSLFMIFVQGKSLGFAVLAALPFLVGGVLYIGKKSEPLSVKQQSTLDAINRNMREGLTGLRVIRAFCNEDFQEKRFEEVNSDYADVSRKLFQLMALALPGFSAIFTVLMSVVIWVGANRISVGTLQVGTLAAFIEYLFHALFSFMLFAIVFTMYPRAAVSANRIQKILDTASSISPNPQGITKTQGSGRLVFENVSFAYADNAEEPVLRDISFSVEPGQTVAFIGSTGSGKSTLVQLIPRFYDVTGGRILLDGVDVREYHLGALRKKIGFIPQKALLFSGTIAENLRYGKRNASHEELESAAEIAQAKSFIYRKKHKYETFLSEGGKNMSGGQKQRLSIARALVKRPSLYVFDDSFSALDYQTDTRLRARLQEETKGATVLIVAQRVGTIRNADKIFVLSEGELVASGTHSELLKNCPLYYDIAASQLAKEELE